MHLRQLFLHYQSQTSDFPLMLEIVKAKGIYMYGAKGEKYIDLISGISVSNLGHRHKKVVKAIKQQLKKYMHLMVYGELIQSPQVKLAEALSQSLAYQLDSVYFVNSGSEAIEGAMKVAKRYTQRTEIISCFDAYHGSSHGALSIGGGEQFKNAFRPLLPDIRQIRFGNLDDLVHITPRTACVVIEVIQAEAGVRLPSAEYLQALRAKCTAVGALLVIDEIQTGFGRTGTFWAFQHYQITPDLLVCAKAMGGGMPIGAFIGTQKIMSVLKNNPILGHITTFGGHPVSCAASLATLKEIRKGKLLEKVAEKEALFHKLLVHEKIKSVRSKGLLIAVEFEDFATLKPIIDQAIQLGVLTDWFLYCDNSMRIAPPLTIKKSQIYTACQLILQAIEIVSNHQIEK
jgi:acetylornithine/succinyldiaminopimelate/putrescine aminotransferase